MPRVTVIIPTFNYAPVLPYSIGSVLRQTFADFELLVIGDHCTDESESVVKSIADPRVRWINLEKAAGHQSGPNNEGIRQAKGDLVAYLGHDDLWLPRHLAMAVGAIDQGAGLSYALTEMVRPGDPAPWAAPVELEYVPGMWIPPTNVVHRRETAIKAGLWKHFNDVPDKDPESDLWERIYRSGARVQFIRMLTAVKFSALKRKNVYAERPFNEQAEWSRRIADEPDFAATELAKMLPQFQGNRPFSAAMREFVTETIQRIRRRLRSTKLTRREIYEARLRFKGVKR